MNPVFAATKSARAPAAAALLAGLLGGPAWALDDAAALAAALPPTATGAAERPLNLEVSSTSLPRFEATDGAPRTERIDMTAWLGPSRPTGLGVSMGLVNMGLAGAPGAAGLGLNPSAGTANPQAMDLGLQWRYTLDANYRINVAAWRRVNPPDALTLIQSRQPAYGARVEMQLKNVRRNGFVVDHGFIGLQLDGGDTRIQLRRKDGKPAIYLRTKF